MKLRQLGTATYILRPSASAHGRWAAGKWEFAWGPQDDKDSIEAIHAGLDRGLNWIDTPPSTVWATRKQSSDGAIKDLRERPYVFTKCSLVWDEQGGISHNLQAASIRREAEGSLKRLGWNASPLSDSLARLKGQPKRSPRL